MRKIKRYESEDGKEFKTKHECIEHEHIVNEVNDVMSKLKPQPEGFYNNKCGIDYIKQDKDTFLLVKKLLLNIISRYIEEIWLPSEICKEGDINLGLHMHHFDAQYIFVLRKAWYRIILTDNKYHEYNHETAYFHYASTVTI